MKNKLFLFSLVFFIALMPVFALNQSPELGSPGELIAWLSPIIIWAAGLAIKPFTKVPGWVMLTIVVPLLSFIASWLLQQSGLTDLNFIMQFLYGLGAVFIDQVKKQLPALN